MNFLYTDYCTVPWYCHVHTRHNSHDEDCAHTRTRSSPCARHTHSHVCSVWCCAALTVEGGGCGWGALVLRLDVSGWLEPLLEPSRFILCFLRMFLRVASAVAGRFPHVSLSIKPSTPTESLQADQHQRPISYTLQHARPTI